MGDLFDFPPKGAAAFSNPGSAESPARVAAASSASSPAAGPWTMPRANHAASLAVATSQRRNSLWKGELGVAVLVADLASPENARMPFFE